MGAELLKRIYLDPTSPASYGGLEKLYREVKRRRPRTTRREVQEWALGELAYALHRPVRKRFPRNPVTVFSVDELWQADLVDLQRLSGYNDGVNYLLTVIDVFSKKAWVRTLQNKKPPTVMKAFLSIVRSRGRRPLKLQTDAGWEFRDVAAHLRNPSRAAERASGSVRFYVVPNEVKASVIERFNRTLKTRMWRYFTAHNTFRYLDVLPALVDSYNRTPHRTLEGRTPDSVGPDNQLEVWRRVYKPLLNTSGACEYKFQLGDLVRISVAKDPREKGYLPNWSEEYFTVTARVCRRRPVYQLTDLEGEAIEGKFYENELTPANDKQDLFEERAVERRGNSRLVKWRGWPAKFNRWLTVEKVLKTGRGDKRLVRWRDWPSKLDTWIEA